MKCFVNMARKDGRLNILLGKPTCATITSSQALPLYHGKRAYRPPSHSLPVICISYACEQPPPALCSQFSTTWGTGPSRLQRCKAYYRLPHMCSSSTERRYLSRVIRPLPGCELLCGFFGDIRRFDPRCPDYCARCLAYDIIASLQIDIVLPNTDNSCIEQYSHTHFPEAFFHLGRQLLRQCRHCALQHIYIRNGDKPCLSHTYHTESEHIRQARLPSPLP